MINRLITAAILTLASCGAPVYAIQSITGG